MNVTLIIALITALSAIFAPSITALIQGHFNLKLKQYEYTYEKKIEAYKDFAVKYGMLNKNDYLDVLNGFLFSLFSYAISGFHF